MHVRHRPFLVVESYEARVVSAPRKKNDHDGQRESKESGPLKVAFNLVPTISSLRSFLSFNSFETRLIANYAFLDIFNFTIVA